ncbi:contractile injection system tape measure protein [Prevotella sp. oral taxon 376]|uniref:contractile injection system tape measure protein n=1 Tax=Prevotella sp. oral taxon 376 TaxID=712466 RepID=UPI0011B20D0E|nr:contractile injection system tape measure protein [Prevotella sp. oral taxon 376]
MNRNHENIINNVTLHFQYDSFWGEESQVTEIAEKQYDDYVLPVLEEVIEKYSNYDLNIENLCIDLGAIKPSDIPDKLRLLLDEEIRSRIAGNRIPGSPEWGKEVLADEPYKAINEVLRYLVFEEVPWTEDAELFIPEQWVNQYAELLLSDGTYINQLRELCAINNTARYRLFSCFTTDFLCKFALELIVLAYQQDIKMLLEYVPETEEQPWKAQQRTQEQPLETQQRIQEQPLEAQQRTQEQPLETQAGMDQPVATQPRHSVVLPDALNHTADNEEQMFREILALIQQQDHATKEQISVHGRNEKLDRALLGWLKSIPKTTLFHLIEVLCEGKSLPQHAESGQPRSQGSPYPFGKSLPQHAESGQPRSQGSPYPFGKSLPQHAESGQPRSQGSPYPFGKSLPQHAESGQPRSQGSPYPFGKSLPQHAESGQPRSQGSPYPFGKSLPQHAESRQHEHSQRGLSTQQVTLQKRTHVGKLAEKKGDGKEASGASGSFPPTEEAYYQQLLEKSWDSIEVELAQSLPASGYGADMDSRRFFTATAGLVLLHPFIPSFLRKLNLLDERDRFASINDAVHAVHLLHFLASDEELHHSHKLSLEKLLCGLPVNFPIPREYEIEKEERQEVNNLLAAVCQHWKPLNNTSISGLQYSFIQRSGLLDFEEPYWTVRVKGSAIDILMNDLPWGCSTIMFPWIENMIWIDWQPNN